MIEIVAMEIEIEGVMTEIIGQIEAMVLIVTGMMVSIFFHFELTDCSC